jgi:hypothetical protein
MTEAVATGATPSSKETTTHGSPASYSQHQGNSDSMTSRQESNGAATGNWWIPAEGISREVIQLDIQRYLGTGAWYKPGKGIGENEVSRNRVCEGL